MDATINTSLMGLAKAKESINQSAHKISNYHLEPSKKQTSPPDTLASKNIEMKKSYYSNPQNRDTDLGKEVVNMIQSSRAYEANLRVVSAWSELLEDEVNLSNLA